MTKVFSFPFTLIVSLPWTLNAQQYSISGTVGDGLAVMPGVSISLKDVLSPQARTTLARDAKTDSEGKYRFENLTAGTYRLSFSKPGFEKAERTIVLEAEPVVLNVSLVVAGISTSIEVTDAPSKATASRMAVPDTDLPVQVSPIPLQVLQEQGVNDTVTALRNVSGASAFRGYGMYEYYTIRGFSGSSNVQLVDGMRLEGNRLNTQLNNVERIEVLKGPSSILYGGQALSGAINLIRKKPQAQRSYDFFYRGGRFNTHQAGGGATGNVWGLSSLLYRVDTSFESADAWRRAGARRFNLSPALTWLISERSRITVTQSFNRDNFDGDAGVPVGILSRPDFDASRRFNTPQDLAASRDSQTGAFFTFALPRDFQFRNSFLYRAMNDEYFTAESLTYQPVLDSVGRQFLYFKHHRRPILNQTDVTGSLQLFGMRHTVLAGYEYQDYYNFTHRSAGRSVATLPISLVTWEETHVFVPDFPVSRKDYTAISVNALFWQDQIALSKRLQVNIGGRFDDYRSSVHNDPWADGRRTSRSPDLRRHQTPYTYRAGLVYSLAANQQAYFSSATSFQAVTQIPADGRELQPETGRSFEVGYRWQGFQGRFSVSAAAYRLVRKNVVIALPNQQFDQAGQQSSKGVDIDLSGEIGKGLFLVANYGYSNPRYDEYYTSNRTVNLSRFRPRFTQRHAANLWITKTWRSGLTASVGNRYLSSMYTSDLNDLRLGGWTTFSGSIGFRGRFYDWSVNAENLLNRRRYFFPGQIANQVYPGPPINLFTTLRFRFRQ